ncbi:hypothetical protein [Pantoea sp. 18069]|uniref:hypothetical protein n=1 Tax=Pantoea sp. 18069 TaxID=2681415 RepID=UPI001357EAA1|nr:hypothetical protein [Pantoea sp. 18069]
MPSAPQRPRKHTDESFVITAVTIGLISCIALGYLLDWYLENRNTREMNRAKTEVYQQYLHNTPSQQPKPLPEALAERLKVRDQLLAHPAVKPGPGFTAPGVQSTGKAIIDAIDLVQDRQASPRF